jgi:hypothetical protein
MDVPLKKFCATCLVVLVLLPFTAPWSVCSAADVRTALTGDGLKPREPHLSARSMSPEAPRDPATMVVAPVENRHRHSNVSTAPAVRLGSTRARSAPRSPESASLRIDTSACTSRPPAVSTALRI